MSAIDLEVHGMNSGSYVKHVTQALQPLTGGSGMEINLQSDHVLGRG